MPLVPSAVGVLSTPVSRDLASRFSFFKRGLGVCPPSFPRSSRRLLGAPFARPPEEPATEKIGAPSGGEGTDAPPPFAAAAPAAAPRDTGSPQNLSALVPVSASSLAWRVAILSEVNELWSQSQSGCVQPGESERVRTAAAERCGGFYTQATIQANGKKDDKQKRSQSFRPSKIKSKRRCRLDTPGIHHLPPPEKARPWRTCATW